MLKPARHTARLSSLLVIALFLTQLPLLAQTSTQEGAQPPAKSGSAESGVFPPVLDAQHRPITAGGTVANGPIVFQEAAQKAGLTVWHHTMGSPDKRYILESIGSGVALLDYDNDGWLDIYLVNGSTQAAMDGKAAPPRAPHSSTTTTTAPSPM